MISIGADWGGRPAPGDDFLKERDNMPKYLFEANYTAEGLKGPAKDKGTGTRGRRLAPQPPSVGGSVEAFYYAFGDRDAAFLIGEPARQRDRRRLRAGRVVDRAGGGRRLLCRRPPKNWTGR